MSKRTFSQSTCQDTQSDIIPAVDESIIDHDKYEIVKADDGSYKSVYLQMSNCDANNNKYYICQLLKDKKSNKIKFYTRFGRVGDAGKQTFKDVNNELAGIKDYDKTKHQKTSPGKGYRVVDMDLGSDSKPIKTIISAKKD